MKKTLYTLNINNFMPELTEVTFKWMDIYAKKIGAKFEIITERKFPDMPPNYEKFQIYELNKKNGDDWSIFFDADAIIHPDCVDWTIFTGKDTVIGYDKDFANIRWRYDKYFERDGRNIGCGTWFMAVSDLTSDLWHPLEDMTYEEALSNVIPVVNERVDIGLKPEHLIDDYLTSRNVAKYGLKFETVNNIVAKYKLPEYFLYHNYTMSKEEKTLFIKNLVDKDFKLTQL